MAAGRKIEDEREARWCLRAAKREGLRTGDWARAHGVDARSLRAWEMNLGRRGSSVRGPKGLRHTLVELVPAAPVAGAGTTSRYVLEFAGARIEFGDDVSVATLRRVLEALRPC